MCDDNSMADMQKASTLSRRQFGTLGAGATLVAVLPLAANAAAAEVKESEVLIKTPDGMCDAHFAHPASGKAPAVLVWPDIFGLRDAFRLMGRRLAESGYAVLTVNPFYRVRKAPTAPPNPDFEDPDTRAALRELAGGLSPATQATDARAFIRWLDGRREVDSRRKMGTTGYCMGGPIVMRTAANFPDRIGAGGSFHGGGLATDAPESPHLLVPKIKGRMLLAIARNDDARDPQAKETLRKAFADAGAQAEIEVYPADHGWCVIDSRVFDKAQAEKAWGRLLELFRTSLV